ncbi:hypothetical protein [Mycobacterium sp. 050134]|uniref:hypothetical protein n=1 Tax=Mycobacterium sp. 050134 TaxID=3096111 RepID=UPI002ED98BFC
MSAFPISELYEFAPDLGLPASSLPNPLIEQGAMNEAEFIDLRLSPQRSRVGVLFDIRWCEFEGSNAALAVLTGVGKVAWSNDAGRQYPWYSTRGYWTSTIGDYSPPPPPGSEDMWAKGADPPEIASHPKTKPSLNQSPEYILTFDWLSVSGLTARIYIGHIDGLDGAPPDMTELTDAEIIAGFPQWSSVLDVCAQYSYPDEHR